MKTRNLHNHLASIHLLMKYFGGFLEVFMIAKGKNTSMIASALVSAEERLVPCLLLPCAL